MPPNGMSVMPNASPISAPTPAYCEPAGPAQRPGHAVGERDKDRAGMVVMAVISEHLRRQRDRHDLARPVEAHRFVRCVLMPLKRL